MSKTKTPHPNWIEQAPPPGSFRSLFKWGDPHGFKHPNRGMVALLEDIIGMTGADFAAPQRTRLEPFDIVAPVRLDAAHLEALERIVGAQNVTTDTYARTRASYGSGTVDALRLRERVVENLPDVVLAPRTADEVQAIVTYCDVQRIPLTVYRSRFRRDPLHGGRAGRRLSGHEQAYDQGRGV